MATLLLQAAIGTAISVGVGLITRALTPRTKISQEGARLSGTQVTFASESGAIARHWGWNRLQGNIIWSTKFLETKTEVTSTQGGKGGGGGTETTITTYTYSVSFAVAFCEGNDRVQLGRVWADGQVMDLSDVTYRFYKGTETQTADSFIETVEGAGNVPAYRGLCYIVFENLQLESFGNRIPQITAEIIKGPKTLAANDAETLAEGVSLIPAAGEFVYGTEEYVATDDRGNSTSQNVHTNLGTADVLKALDSLEASAPNVDTVNLVLGWFGDDLRCETCDIKPKVEQSANKTVTPHAWAAGGITRSAADAVSVDAEGRPVFGGTPSDRTVRELITELKSRGFRVCIYPFLMMDIPASNTLPDPYSDNAGDTGQSAFPWRGRITVSPAAGYFGSVDQTSAAGTQIAAFTGTAAPGDFGAWDGSTIPYSGPNEWSYRRFILHYAKLTADLLETNDAFIIGSEMVRMTQSRDSATTYPFVDDLVTLAGDVSGMLASDILVAYAADWSEYHSHRPADGSGDVFFNLDPLWSNANIDFVGMDNYLPMSDWRDGSSHLDFLAGYKSIYSSAYLQSNVEGGEYYDWFYASDADRNSQTRTTITDGAAGKPWVFRNKDMRNWWLNLHYNRPTLNQASSPQMQGAATGSPGALPTGWNRFHGGGVAGEIVALHGDGNIVTMDYRISGTASGSGSNIRPGSTVPAAQGDEWTMRFDLAIIAGSAANLATITFRIIEQDSGGSNLKTHTGPDFIGSITSSTQTFSYTTTLTEAATAKIRFQLEITNGTGAVDITLAMSKPWLSRSSDPVESGSSTGWAAESKPIWFTEFGCPAVDKGTNQPNVFVDPKSSESFYPYFSNKQRDDLIQRRYIEETYKYWRDNAPTSSVYGDKMVKPDNMLIWTWDARPYPEFPYLTDVWSDGPNWFTGHWVTGRLPMMTLPSLVTEICEASGLTASDLDTDNLFGALAVVRGFTVEQLASARQMIETLKDAYFFDAFQSQGKINFTLRQLPDTVSLSIEDVVTISDNPGGYELTRAKETELPKLAEITFRNEGRDYNDATVSEVRQVSESLMALSNTYNIVFPEPHARAAAQIQLMEAWAGRETGKIMLPPSKYAIDPGDVLSVPISGRTMSLRVTGMDIGEHREASVISFDAANYGGVSFPQPDDKIPTVVFYGPSIVAFMDLPIFTENQVRPYAPQIAAYQNPWPKRVNVYEDDGNSGWALNTEVFRAGVIGKLTAALNSGPVDVWDFGNTVSVEVYSDDQILGTSELAVLNGANIAAVENADGGWEVFQFQNATLTGTRTYDLTKLLRGQGGTEAEMRDPVAAGAMVVFLSQSDLYALNVSQATIFNDIAFRYGPGTVPVADFRYQEKTVTIGAVGLRPYSPVHLKGTLSGADWELTWIRRTRYNGDSWTPESVPLNEETEEYELEIMDGANVVRTVTDLTTPAFTYTEAMQIADFGSAQSSVTFRVYQMSVIYGRGAVAEGTV